MIKSAEFSFETEKYLELLPDLVCLTNYEGRFVKVNQAWNRIVENPRTNLVGKALIDFVHEEDHSKVMDLLLAFAGEYQAVPHVLRIRFKNSLYRFIEWRTTPLDDTVFWISRDVTQSIENQKVMEGIVYASEEFMEMLPEEIEYQKIAEQLREISDAKYVIINIFEDDDNVYTTRAVVGVKESVKRASKIFGFRFEGRKWPNDPVRYERTKAQCITRFNNLLDFAGHALPHSLIRLIEGTFQIGEVFLAKIEKDGIVLGDFTMIMQAGTEFRQHTLIEIYTRQVGLLITRHNAELALRASEAKFRDLFDKDLTGNFISKLNGEFILINEAFASIFGYDSVDEMMSCSALVTYSQVGDREKFLDLVREKKHLDMFEETLIRRDGQEIVVLENVIGEFDEKGELTALRGYLIDITDRKQAENQLKDNERLLQASQAISEIGSYILDIRSGIWQGSMVLDRMFGIERQDDHSVEGWLSVIHPDDRNLMDSYFTHEVIEKSHRFDKEYRIVSKKTKIERWVHGIGEIEFDMNHIPIKMMGTIQDITERRGVLNELRQSEEKYRMLVEQIDEVIFVLDKKGYIEYMSPVIEQLTGYKTDHYVNKFFNLFIHPDHRSFFLKAFNDLQLGVNTPFEYQILTKDKRECWVRSSTKQIIRDSEIVGYRGVLQNITTKKNDERLLREALSKAEASDRLKSAFLNNISHEVRTPLNGILGFAEMITEPGLTEENKSFYLEILNSSSERLLNTINDYMDISLISSGNMEIRSSMFNLNQLIQTVLTKYATIAQSKNIEIMVTSTDLSKTFLVDSDEELLRKVLTHLLDNAIKYSTGGMVEMGYSKKAEMLEFYMKDEGIGIGEDKQSRIFDYFIQEDLSTTRRYEGSGLGLSIAKGLVELLGGRIWVVSAKGKGSAFRFTISQPSC